jgi:hypothetical protein
MKRKDNTIYNLIRITLWICSFFAGYIMSRVPKFGYVLIPLILINFVLNVKYNYVEDIHYKKFQKSVIEIKKRQENDEKM